MSALRDWNYYKRRVKPAAKEPSVHTVTEADKEVVIAVEEDSVEDLTMASREEVSFSESVKLQRPAPFPNVSVNDGTHRVKIKWSLPADVFTQLISDPDKQNDVPAVGNAMIHFSPPSRLHCRLRGYVSISLQSLRPLGQIRC